MQTLIYVTDPMCSWCWGFSPVIEAVRERYQDRCAIQLLVGGLRPGNTERFDEQRRAYILGHWHAVHERTGQPFNFNFQMDSTFTYDTEPASRAVVAVKNIAPSQEFTYLKHVQEAFYVENRDVTKEDALANLAVDQGLPRDQFVGLFRSPELRENVLKEFDRSRELGVSGFPTLLGQKVEETTILAHGYQSLDLLVPIVETWLNTTATYS